MRQSQHITNTLNVKPLPPLDELRRLFDLDEATGELRWRWRDDVRIQWNANYAGKIAGSLNSEGYRRIRLNGRFHYAHRIVYALATGEPLPPTLDHINGVKDDNRPSNLRPVTDANNRCNSGSREGTSRYCGVSWCKRLEKWKVQITLDYKQRHLGYFHDEEEAARAYDAAAIELHGEFARLNFPQEVAA
jgi:hypothetical protein